MDRKLKQFKLACKTCKKVELLKYPTFWHRQKKGSGNCKKCAATLADNNGRIKKGNVPHNKGVKGWRAGHEPYFVAYGENNPFYGKKHSTETLEQMRRKKLGIIGKDANAWAGGKTKERTLLMSRNDYKQLRKAVFGRDDYTCQICLKRGGNLEMDHIKEWCNYPDLRYEETNCRTLCHNCHVGTDNYLSKARRLVNA